MIDSQVALIRAVQEQAAWLSAPAHFFSVLGHPGCYLLIIAYFYWGRNPQLGLRLGLLMGISAGINGMLKAVFHFPRPYWVSPDVRALGHHPSFSLPSTHAQVAVTFWGLAAATVRRRWFSIVAVVIIALIGASRIVLGVHFPTDIVAGFLVGVAVLGGFFALERPVGRKIAALSPGEKVFAAFAGSLVLVLISVSALVVLGDWEVPASWAAQAVAGSGEPIAPLSLRDAMATSGFFFGFGAGAALDRRSGRVCAETARSAHLFRYITGIAVAGTIWFGSGLLVPQDAGLAALTLQYLQAAAVGAWVSFGAPAAFSRLDPAGHS